MKKYFFSVVVFTFVLFIISPGLLGASPIDDNPPAEVDTFSVGQITVKVLFYDPYTVVAGHDSLFGKKKPAEKAVIYKNYVAGNVIYTFRAENKGNTTWFNIRGNGLDKEGKVKYELVLYTAQKETPDMVTSADALEGALFEHLNVFNETKKERLRGLEISFFEGIPMRVIPYSEIKTFVIERIKEFVSGN